MASKQPIIRQIAWLSLLPQLFIMCAIFVALHIVGTKEPIFLGAVLYLLICLILRRFVPAAHRRGIGLFKKQKFEEAIPEFIKSYDFFNRHKWVDSYRYLTILSSSRMSYREMAILNIAYCYGQIGDGQKSKEYYQQALAEFPDSEIAKSSLRMIESAESGAQHVA